MTQETCPECGSCMTTLDAGGSFVPLCRHCGHQPQITQNQFSELTEY